MCGTGECLAACVVIASCFTAANSVTAGQDGMPVSVVAVSYDANTGIVEFTLANNSRQVVTAWNVRARPIAPDGAVLPKGGGTGTGTDSYLSAAGLVPEGGHIRPGDTLTRSLRLSVNPALADASVAIEVTLAVLSDGSAFGDPKDIEFVFQRREQEYQTWRQVVAILEQALQQGGGLQSLRRAEELLVSKLAGDPQNAVRDSVLGNVRLAITDVERGQADANGRLQWLLENGRSRLTAVATHRRANPDNDTRKTPGARR